MSQEKNDHWHLGQAGSQASITKPLKSAFVRTAIKRDSAKREKTHNNKRALEVLSYSYQADTTCSGTFFCKRRSKKLCAEVKNLTPTMRGRRQAISSNPDLGPRFYGHPGHWYVASAFQCPHLNAIPDQLPSKVRSISELLGNFPALYAFSGDRAIFCADNRASPNPRGIP
jgi:hypothetical protein